jgi:IclR family pca regulon transcriptional regulator
MDTVTRLPARQSRDFKSGARPAVAAGTRPKRNGRASVAPRAFRSTANSCITEGRISERDCIGSFARGLEVIRAFSRTSPRMTLSEVAAATSMTRASVRRFLLTLVREGYAGLEGKYFGLRPKILELGFSALASMDMWEIAQPVMNDLSERLQESCFAAVLDRDDVIYVARATPQRVVNVGISIGSRVPAYCVSTGRILLAYLSPQQLGAYVKRVGMRKITPNTITSKIKLRAEIEKARQQHWCMAGQEFELGLRSISVPIRDRAGQVIAALNVCCPSTRVSPELIRTRVLVELRDAAGRISAALRA